MHSPRKKRNNAAAHSKCSLFIPAIYAVVLLFTCFLGTAKGGSSQLTTEARENFEWFGSLGYPDLKKSSWVEIWSGSYQGSVSPKPITTQGFLLSSSKDKFEVMLPDLRTIILKKTGPKTQAFEKVAYKEKDFPQAAENFLAAIRGAEEDDISMRRREFGLRLGLKSQVFVLAYACWHKGNVALAQKLFDAAHEIPPWNIQAPKSKESMRQTLERELAHAATWQAVLQFGGGDWYSPEDEPFPTRRELLASFENLERRFPNNPHTERVEMTVALLKQMIAEDEKHPILTREQIAKLPVEEQVREWIFQLRDQNGHQFSQPGSCDIFEEHKEGGQDTPAYQLVKIGYPAVPQLIEALSDPRFSRSVGFHRDFHFSHHVLTVGDCAQQILNRIAGRSFYVPVTTSSYMARDSEIAQTRSEVEKWWTEFQRKGEAQVLIDGISEGQQPPYAQIERLKIVRPDAVENAVLTGAIASQYDDGPLGAYLEALGNIKSDAARDLLREQMLHGKERHNRVTSAKQLWKRDDPTVIPAMIAEWKRKPPAHLQELEWKNNDVIQLLAASGEMQAMEALAADWETRSPRQKFEIVKIIGETLRADSSSLPALWEMKSKKPDDKILNRAERLLVRALNDSSISTGMSITIGNFTTSNPRICDFALWSLNRIFPDRYVFSEKASRKQRELERVLAANVWHHKHGEQALPLPAKNLPQLRPEDALRITTVTITPGAPKSAEKFFAQAASLKGSRFDENTIASIFKQFVAQEVSGVAGLQIEASRENDFTGITMIVKWIPGKYPHEGEWKIFHAGTAGEQSTGNSSGGWSYEHAKEDDAWKSSILEIRKLLKTPPNTEFLYNAGLEAQ